MQSHFDITAFGALPDGKTLNTAAIQQAIDACHQAGGGTVWCGPGTFITGSVRLKSNVEFHLAPGCRILGSTRVEDYDDLVGPGFRHHGAPERSHNYLIGAVDAQNIAITGPGQIDGSGAAFYGSLPEGQRKFAKPDTPRPRIAIFYRCKDVRIEQATLMNASCWTCWLMWCERVHIHKVKIEGDHRLRNVDGIDLDSCRDVTVSDCIIHTEDDCIVLRAMQHLYDEPAVCENVVVTNCVLDSYYQGVRVGCPSDGVIRNCTLSNLTIRCDGHGIAFDHPPQYLKDAKGTATTHDIQFSNITIQSGKNPIRIAIGEGIELPRLGDLSFANMRLKSSQPCLIQGSNKTLVENVRLSDIEIQTTGDDAVILRQCKGIKLSNVELSNQPATT